MHSINVYLRFNIVSLKLFILTAMLLPLPSFQIHDHELMMRQEKVIKEVRISTETANPIHMNEHYISQRITDERNFKRNKKFPKFSKIYLNGYMKNKTSVKVHSNNQRYEQENTDIFIAVRTTEKFHHSRLEIILKTWYNLAPEKVNI